jgi:HNH endonuclease
MPARYWVKCSWCFTEIYRVTFNYGKNREMLNFFCNDKICKANWQIGEREKLGYTKEWLESQYITLGKTANQIAKEIGRDPKRVWEWIRNYGLETRSRGSYVSNQFQKGQESAFKGKSHSDESKQKFREFQLENSHLRGKFGKDHPRFGLRPKSWKGGIAGLRQTVYGTQEWKECVKTVWKRDDATCQRCNLRKNNARETPFDIHHIVSFEVAKLRTEVSNLILMCEPCHYWAHAKKNQPNQFIKELELSESNQSINNR